MLRSNQSEISSSRTTNSLHGNGQIIKMAARFETENLSIIFSLLKIGVTTIPLMLFDYITDLYSIFTYASSTVGVMLVAAALLGK